MLVIETAVIQSNYGQIRVKRVSSFQMLDIKGSEL